MAFLSRYTWWLGAMAALVVALTLAGQVRLFDPVQGVFLGATQPLERAVTALTRPVANLLRDIGDLDAIREENRRLRLENEALQVRNAQMQTDAALARELQDALNQLKESGTDTRLLATVVHRDASAFTDVVSIDRGSSDGLREGMPVLSAQGSLLGTVARVLPGQAFVRLITDSRSRVAGQVIETQAEGVLAGDLTGGLSLTLARSEVRPGDVIVTSGLGGNYPQGIPVGRVLEVEGTPQDLFRTITVEPLVRLSTVRTVIVMTGFLPAAVSVPD